MITNESARHKSLNSSCSFVFIFFVTLNSYVLRFLQVLRSARNNNNNNKNKTKKNQAKTV